MREFLAAERGFPLGELDRYCYGMADREAVHHLFRVTASLDSMVLGEVQILKQVKAAHQAALRARSIGAVLDPLLRKALGVAKRVRTETGIARHPTSISYAAVSLARTIFEDLSGRKIILIGAGKMGELAARHLLERGIASIYVANRSFPRAVELARTFDGEAVHFDRILEVLEKVDIAISSTASPQPILRYEDVVRLIRARKNRPIFLIGMPRSGTTLLFTGLAVHPQLAWFSQYTHLFPRLTPLAFPRSRRRTCRRAAPHLRRDSRNAPPPSA